ncbi:type 2 lanthipeptide synthetase LanM family protein [Micromonospora profundi]|uniref:Type 2 lanthipeptide synthetase LanM family protein n=1 Tax=Micromonospora profundi TaxID=1420889 RepID=A0AAJ6L4G5_9ACTN|nr:type 2 lanthipeptide synthetase LanM family protein [Micromonospora profundi]WLS45901.1 type 2 lanthipeptide synthetase LanM family protein [Micromonospora profundi]
MNTTDADGPPGLAPAESPRLRRSWWARGLALHERVTVGGGTDPVDAGRLGHARQRLDLWRADRGPELDVRLGELGVDEDLLLTYLAEEDGHLAARVDPPPWAVLIEAAVRAAAQPPSVPVAANWRSAFALPLRPLVDQARTRFRRDAVPVTDAHVDLGALDAALTATLERQLAALAARALIEELHRRRSADLLQGDDSRARFVDFIRQIGTSAGLAALFTDLPVLARLLGQATAHATDAMLELLARYTADREHLVDDLLGGADPGPLVAVDDSRGDPHQSGRTTTVIQFADGRRLVYKPRDLTHDDRLAAFVGWMNRMVPTVGMRTAACLARPEYGWTEFVIAAPLADPDGADRFYRRQGALLALAHALNTTDLHYENVIASGEDPVAIDVETLFSPSWRPATQSGDPAADLLAASVHRTALLPLMVVGEQGIMDLSAAGGDHGRQSPVSQIDWADPCTDRMRLVRRAGTFDGASNRPRLGDRVIDPEDHEAAMLEGFRLGYEAIEAHRADFTQLVEASSAMTVRLVVRPTWAYRTLLDEATHPSLLRDGLDRDRFLGQLCGRTTLPGDPLFARHEIVALWRGDVPYFHARADSSLLAADGEPTAVPLHRSGVGAALDRIAGFGEADRQDQEWVIMASLATRRPVGTHDDAAPMPGPPHGTAAPPERLVSAACAIADQLVARGAPGRDRVNWLGLELVDDRQWLLLPMGAGLANGYLGVALFLGQLAHVTGVARYGEVARRAVAATPGLLRLLSDRPELVTAIGCGGLHGLGGLAYALARLAVLLDDPEIGRWVDTTVELAEVAVAGSTSDDWATGQAGCLAAMTSIHAELGLDRAAALARTCADNLADTTASDQPASPAGFADGTAGIAYALHRFVDIGGGSPRHADAARKALRHARQTPNDSSGWCAGTSGLAIALAGQHDEGTSVTSAPDAPADLVRRLADRPLSRDLSLCHGESGVGEALTVLAAGPAGPAAAAALRQHTTLVLNALQWQTRYCGTPDGVLTPGLLTGLAGIGYGLLRSALAARIPSALLLEPTPPPTGSGWLSNPFTPRRKS